ncbi:MAG: prolipoprotein diacylglyceryl transferase [Chloroflexi bacterium]|nr:prolipoprotein diacylglyceryl transferase [Chloroflexota bacterium]
MFPILQLGPLAIQTPGLALLIGVWAGLALAEKEAARLKLNPDTIYNLALTGLVGGIIGARLAYAARYFGIYAADPLSLFSLNPATLAPTEGALIGLTAALVYGSRHKLPLRLTLDALTPALAVMGMAIAAAHLASGDAFGAPAHLPWGIYLWEDYRHPSQVYELMAAVIVLGMWWRTHRRLNPGIPFWSVAAASASTWVFLEAFRGDSLITVGGLRLAQLWGIALLGTSLAMIGVWNQKAAAPAAALENAQHD